jgi:hypothetical protein
MSISFSIDPQAIPETAKRQSDISTLLRVQSKTRDRTVSFRFCCMENGRKTCQTLWKEEKYHLGNSPANINSSFIQTANQVTTKNLCRKLFS